jgi:hypothetical protein
MRDFRAGSWVTVRSSAEILASLDSDAVRDGLPFMPEMLPFTGRTFQVAQVADRTCVHPPQIPLPRLADSVVLRGLRCNGSAHGDCQLGCMLFWKTAWLRPADGPADGPADAPDGDGTDPGEAAVAERLPVHPPDRPDLFRCQGTQLPQATTAGPPLWAPGQYLGFLRDGTFTPRELLGMVGRLGGRIVTRKLRPSPPRAAAEPSPTNPAGSGGLQPGDWVRVRSADEIESTLDSTGKLNGLAFASEMKADCGKTLQVQQRVDRIIDERNGRLREVQDTVILHNSICDRYLGCARSMPILWREAWLEPLRSPLPTSG